MTNVWNNPQFVDGWNATYGLDMVRAPIRAGIIYPLLAERLGTMQGLNMVEFGCGNGNLAHHFRDRAFASWTGYDGGAAVLATARAHLADPRVTFHVADLTRSLPAPRKADALAAIFVIEELPLTGLRGFFNNVARALKPKAPAYFFTNHPVHAMAEDHKARAASRPNTKFKGHKGYFDTQPSTYALELLNQRDGMAAEAQHHHKPLSAIINAAVQAGLAIDEMAEVPAGIGTMAEWRAHTPKSGDVPRFLFIAASQRA